MMPRRFRLVRHQDVSGVSGVGPVAEGIEFTDGSVALRWTGPNAATTIWERGVQPMLAIHGHSGATTVQWIDSLGPLRTGTAWERHDDPGMLP